jgi:integrase
VWRSLKRENNLLLLGPPKTAGSIRTLRMSTQLVEALLRHRRIQEIQKVAAADLWNELDLIVTTEVGTLVDPSNSRRSLNDMCERAGLEHWSPNELRHSFASLMSLSGAPMEDVTISNLWWTLQNLG